MIDCKLGVVKKVPFWNHGLSTVLFSQDNFLLASWENATAQLEGGGGTIVPKSWLSQKLLS